MAQWLIEEAVLLALRKAERDELEGDRDEQQLMRRHAEMLALRGRTA